MKKYVFIEGHKFFDIIKDWEKFLKIMKKFELYLLGFNIYSIIKAKNYFLNYERYFI